MTLRYISLYRPVLIVVLLVISQNTLAASPGCNKTLTATLTQDLDFGDYEGTNGGTVTVDTNGIRTATAGVDLIGGNVTAATYTFSNSVNHCKNQWITISTPASISISGPATMTVTNFVTSVPLNKFKIKNNTTVTIGADLVTNNGQATGLYDGSFSVDFNY